MIYHLDKTHFLPIDKTRAYIDTNILSLYELMINIPAVNEDTITNRMLAKGKYKDNGRIFDRCKLQMELIFDD